MRNILKGIAALLGVVGASSTAEAQTLRMMKSLDAPHYDAQRTTWSPTSDIVNMIQDTLVALDWDGKTSIPYLAKSWTVSEDGKLYTFKLRDDVTFCSGKKFTADDVVYSFNRLKDPETRAPYAWRAGNIKELRATDPYTVEYELAEPFSELLLQLTMFTNAIHNKESVEALGKDYGIKGIDGTGPWCFVSWQPRTEIVLKRHDAYKWGPSMYKNKGPVKFEKLSIKIVPEDSSRVAAMMGGQFDFTNQFPLQFLQQAQDRADAHRAGGQAELSAAVLRFQDHPAHGVRPPGAPGDEHRHQPRRDRQGHILRQCRPGLHLRRSRGAGLRHRDQGRGEGGYRTGEEAARRGRLEAWRRRHPREGRREAGAQGVLHVQVANFGRVSEAIQGYLRKIGVDWRLQPFDSTIAPAKMAEQDYEIWTVAVPYLSAGELMNLYFDSKNIPTPNRMNWKDPETDEWLRLGRAALTDADRAKYYMLVQKKVADEHLWIPVINVSMYLVTNKKLKGARPHMLYQNTFYKGLDSSF